MPTQGQLDAEAATDALKASVVDLLVAIGMAEADGSADARPTAAAGRAPTAVAGGPDARATAADGAPNPGDEAGWSPRQVLAHVVWWHERYLKVLSAKIDGRARPKLAGTLDDINVAGVAAYGGRSIDDLADTLRAKEHALESLLSVLFELPAAQRARLRILTRDGSTPVDLDGLVKRITGHLHGHARDIREASKAR